MASLRRFPWQLNVIYKKSGTYKGVKATDLDFKNLGCDVSNWHNPFKLMDWDKYDEQFGAESNLKLSMAEASKLEKVDIDKSISLYLEILDTVDGFAKLFPEKKLAETLGCDVSPSLFHGNVQSLERLSILLCKKGNGGEAANLAFSYFEKYPLDIFEAKGESVRKRVMKIMPIPGELLSLTLEAKEKREENLARVDKIAEHGPCKQFEIIWDWLATAHLKILPRDFSEQSASRC